MRVVVQVCVYVAVGRVVLCTSCALRANGEPHPKDTGSNSPGGKATGRSCDRCVRQIRETQARGMVHTMPRALSSAIVV